ncbi:MAG: septum formation inhibitor Maf [Gammaproteobacteria bacterium]|nr:MAG: septum formation inhibitor Maf [Gammaproteobacteria bacterium]
MHPPIILASTSPYRRQLLERLGLPFTVEAPGIEEARLPGESPERMVQRLAEQKAGAVYQRHPEAVVIGSDQAAVVDGEILGKPGDRQRAFQQLKRASGKRLEFLTGLCVLGRGRKESAVIPFGVVFRTLSDQQIESYLRREQPYDCAGSFRSEGLGIILVERMEGEDPHALIGLPLIRLVDMLKTFQIEL